MSEPYERMQSPTTRVSVSTITTDETALGYDKALVTEGPRIVNDIAALVYQGTGICPIAAMTWPTKERAEAETYANACLIAEAGTVLHETGRTPRELADEVKRLLAKNERLETALQRIAAPGRKIAFCANGHEECVLKARNTLEGRS